MLQINLKMAIAWNDAYLTAFIQKVYLALSMICQLVYHSNLFLLSTFAVWAKNSWKHLKFKLES